MVSSLMRSASRVNRWVSSATPPGKFPSMRVWATQWASSMRRVPTSSVV